MRVETNTCPLCFRQAPQVHYCPALSGAQVVLWNDAPARVALRVDTVPDVPDESTPQGAGPRRHVAALHRLWRGHGGDDNDRPRLHTDDGGPEQVRS